MYVNLKRRNNEIGISLKFKLVKDHDNYRTVFVTNIIYVSTYYLRFKTKLNNRCI